MELADVESDGELADAEQGALELVADIRAAIASEIKGAVGVDAVRAALARLFTDFIVHSQRGARFEGDGRAEVVDVDAGHMIELRIRPTALVGYSADSMYPMLRREPLRSAEDNHSVGWATK